MASNEYTIDATERSVGRIATEAAIRLRGKDTAAFAKNVRPGVTVHVVNAAKANIHYKKRAHETYDRYSGYQGGRKVETMQEIIDKKGYSQLIRKAVYGMLPNNKSRRALMKYLVVSD